MTRTLEAIYEQHCAAGTAMSPHLPRLRELAAACGSAVEFGVKRGGSSSAILLGLGDGRLTSYDIVETPQARELKAVAGERWDYLLEDSRVAGVPAAEF